MSFDAFKIKEDDQGTRIDVFLAKHLPEQPSRSFVKKLIEQGHVTVNESTAKANYKIHAGDDIHIKIPPNFLKPQYAEPEDIPLNIFYQDEDIIIVNKVSGMVVHPAPGCYSGTLVNALLNLKITLSDFNEDMRPGIVHRLDQNTSGLIIVAKHNIAHTRLAKQFQRHLVQKQYVALVEGKIEFDEGLIEEPLGPHPRHHEKRAVRYDDKGKESQTRYRVITRTPTTSLVKLFPKTGRTHQLRVHLAYLKHPILGDDKYGKKDNFPRLALHAQGIKFLHPMKKEWVEFVCSIPKEFLEKVQLS